MSNKTTIVSFNDLFLYLDDINQYVNSILLYHQGYNNLDLDEILIYLSCVSEIIEDIKKFICEKIG